MALTPNFKNISAKTLLYLVFQLLTFLFQPMQRFNLVFESRDGVDGRLVPLLDIRSHIFVQRTNQLILKSNLAALAEQLVSSSTVSGHWFHMNSTERVFHKILRERNQ